MIKQQSRVLNSFVLGKSSTSFVDVQKSERHFYRTISLQERENLLQIIGKIFESMPDKIENDDVRVHKSPVRS